MIKKLTIIACLVLISMSFQANEATAFNGLASAWRANYPAACQTLQDATTDSQGCVMCHTSGFGLNPYGDDYNQNDRDFAAIEELDSDGDGRTNGEEINDDCTLPGDQASPVDADTWGGIKALFR